MNIPYIKSGIDPTPLKKSSTTRPYLVSSRDLAGEWQMTEAGLVRILSWDIPNRAGGEASPLVECYNAMITAGDLAQDCLEKGRRKQERLQPWRERRKGERLRQILVMESPGCCGFSSTLFDYWNYFRIFSSYTYHINSLLHLANSSWISVNYNWKKPGQYKR